jgi:hypothetical protein
MVAPFEPVTASATVAVKRSPTLVRVRADASVRRQVDRRAPPALGARRSRRSAAAEPAVVARHRVAARSVRSGAGAGRVAGGGRRGRTRRRARTGAARAPGPARRPARGGGRRLGRGHVSSCGLGRAVRPAGQREVARQGRILRSARACVFSLPRRRPPRARRQRCGSERGVTTATGIFGHMRGLLDEGMGSAGCDPVTRSCYRRGRAGALRVTRGSAQGTPHRCRAAFPCAPRAPQCRARAAVATRVARLIRCAAWCRCSARIAGTLASAWSWSSPRRASSSVIPWLLRAAIDACARGAARTRVAHRGAHARRGARRVGALRWGCASCSTASVGTSRPTCATKLFSHLLTLDPGGASGAGAPAS